MKKSFYLFLLIAVFSALPCRAKTIVHVKDNPNLDLTISDRHVIFDADYTAKGNISFGKNVTLEFQGGMILGGTNSNPITLTGNLTSVIAPITQIFGPYIVAKGSWQIDRAFPQWFGAVTYNSYEQLPSSKVSCSKEINKAITMAGKGETFLPRGIYVVDNVLQLPAGGRLVGASSGQSADEQINSSCIYLNLDKKESAGVLKINVVDDNTQQKINPTSSAYVSQLYFVNKISNKPNEIPTAIIIGCGVTIDNVAFYNFPCAVKNISGEYLDGKTILNCTYSNYIKFDENQMSETPYAFDLPGLGDAFIFQNNKIHTGRSYVNESEKVAVKTFNQGLRVSTTGGCLISDNIINGDVQITGAKALTYSNNHMEYGAQIRISQSSVSLRNNWIEVGERTPLLIQGDSWGQFCNVSLDQNCFMIRGVGNYSSTFSEFNMNKEKMVSNYDICLSPLTELKVNNSFRYYLPIPGSSSMLPIGLTLQCTNREYNSKEDLTEVLSDLESFNEHSAWLSINSVIYRQEVKNRYIATVDKKWAGKQPTIGTNPNVLGNWKAGVYTYYIQCIADKKRNLIHDFGNGTYTKKLEVNVKEKSQNTTCNGVEIYIPKSEPCLVRLVRQSINEAGATINDFCEIPVCGTYMLVDTFDCLNGKKWQPLSGAATSLPAFADWETMNFLGENVEGTSSKAAAPTFGNGWIPGDRLFNIGTGSWTTATKKK